MTVLSNTFKAAAVALTLAGTALTAMPANAQQFGLSFGNDNFRFGISSGGGHYGGHGYHRGPGWHGGPRYNANFCMSDPQVRRDLRADGYRDIRFFDRRGRVVQVTAELGNRDYQIAYDTCRGRIVDRDRV